MRPRRQRLGRAVRRRRRAAGFSQEAFADHVGVHRTYMGAVERGEVNISLDNIERVAHGLRVPPSRLLAAAEADAEGEHGVGTEAQSATVPDSPPDGPSRRGGAPPG